MADFVEVKKRKRRPFSSTEKTLIFNTYTALRNSCPLETTNNEVARSVGESMGIHWKSVLKIVKEVCDNEEPSSPKKKRPRLTADQKLDEFTKCALRRKVHVFFFKNENPTIDRITEEINKDADLPNFSRSTLYRILKSLGFKYAKRGRNSLLLEKPELVLWRRKYLDTIKDARRKGISIFFMDETWLNAGHVSNKTWQDFTITSSREAFLEGLSVGLKNPSGKGQRIIIVHIGNENGFVEGGLLSFVSKTGNDDYHKDMNATVFEEWFENILDKLPEGAIVVMDNAPYHSRRLHKIPNSNTRKQEIVDWLQMNGIPFEESCLKVQLLDIVKQNRHRFEGYVVDEIAKSKGRRVVRLPPYHCELNPIELVWAQIKGMVASQNTTFKKDDVLSLLNNAVKKIDASRWSACVKHVTAKVEPRFDSADRNAENMTESFIISTGSLTSSDSESDDLYN